jgi:hypothetical protein
VISLDVADLVVIAGQALGIGTDAALGQLDVAAAHAALAQAHPAGERVDSVMTDPGAAAAAAIRLMHALLRDRPFPRHGEQIAVAAGLQFLSLNGWRADLDPPATAAVIVEALASGQLNPASAVAWMAPRLSPDPVPALRMIARRGSASRTGARLPQPLTRASMSARRVLVSLMLTIVVSGLALLATACSRGLAAPAGHPHPPATVQTGSHRP